MNKDQRISIINTPLTPVGTEESVQSGQDNLLPIIR